MNKLEVSDQKHYQSNYFDIEFLGHVAHIKLNRPEKRNAMNWDFWRDLPRIVGDIDTHARARCIVLSSTGPVFSAGLDLSLFGQDVFASSKTAKMNEKELQTPQNFMSFLSFLQDSISSLQKARIPVICAIQGGCIGGGVDLICSADIRLATNDAFFSIRETKIGMVADVGTFPRIVKLLPEGIVKELAFTGRNFSAQEAKEYGFVNKLYESHDSLIEGALEIANEIASNSPAAVYGCKRVIDFSRDHTIDEGLEWINMWNASMLSQSELMEGFQSYKSKKEGNFAELPKLKDHFSKE
jgi:enoyl-CoA hydratase|tara:strand:- start:20 stop:913 length:894 start_codon:yes stop_codon:yes gene_type:complete